VQSIKHVIANAIAHDKPLIVLCFGHGSAQQSLNYFLSRGQAFLTAPLQQGCTPYMINLSLFGQHALSHPELCHIGLLCCSECIFGSKSVSERIREVDECYRYFIGSEHTYMS